MSFFKFNCNAIHCMNKDQTDADDPIDKGEDQILKWASSSNK